MSVRYHFDTTFGALKRWFISQCYDSFAVAAMWLVALLILRVPFAPLWALLAGAFQFVPNFGLVLALIGPVMAMLGGSIRPFCGLLIALSLLAIFIAYGRAQAPGELRARHGIVLPPQL